MTLLLLIILAYLLGACVTAWLSGRYCEIPDDLSIGGLLLAFVIWPVALLFVLLEIGQRGRK